MVFFFFFFQAEDGIRDYDVTGVQTCALPIFLITGTIDNPIVKVDPHFDLGKILQNTAVGALGDILEDALSGSDKNTPNPLQLLEELLNK